MSEDKADFQKAMQGVTPLAHTNKHYPSRNAPFEPNPRQRELHEPVSVPILTAPHDPISADTIIAFSRQGVQTQQLKRLQLGQLQHEAVLDLHHLTVDQAQQAVCAFLHGSQQMKHRCVLIIHGKGYHTMPGQLSLKSYLNTWLPQLPAVLAFHTTTPKHGGSGAVSILLKRIKG
jgi:DNA-nicking Smr family endonuclease